MGNKCICPITPEQAIRQEQICPSDLHPVHMQLDHRCAEHGEKALPAVWGRHKELVLSVSIKQWNALRVEPTPEQVASA